MKTIARIEKKTVDAAERKMSGIATHQTPDRLGDIIEAAGVQSAPAGIPLLLHHDHRLPVGRVRLLAPTASGTPFEAVLPRVTAAGVLQDRVAEAWDSVVHQLINFVSIGFRPLDFEVMRDGGIRYKQIEVLELSLVTVPAHPAATVTANRNERSMLLRRLQSTPRYTAPVDRSARLDPGVVAARRARLQRAAQQDERARINLRYFCGIE